MKKLALTLLTLAPILGIKAQEATNVLKDIAQNQGLSGEYVDQVSNSNKLLNLYLEYRGDGQLSYTDGKVTNSSFETNRMNINFKGKFDKFSYDIVYKFTTDANPSGTRDNSGDALSRAFIRYTLNDKWNFTFGKQSFGFGTWEYQYYGMDNYVNTISNDELYGDLTGLTAKYSYTPGNSISAEIANSSDKMYSAYNHDRSMAYSILFENTFADGKIETKAGLHTLQMDGSKYHNWVTAGLKYNASNYYVEADYWNGSNISNYAGLGTDTEGEPMVIRDYARTQATALKIGKSTGKWRPNLKGAYSYRKDINANGSYHKYGVGAVVEYFPFPNDVLMGGFNFHAAYTYYNTVYQKSYRPMGHTDQNTFNLGLRWVFKAI